MGKDNDSAGKQALLALSLIVSAFTALAVYLLYCPANRKEAAARGRSIYKSELLTSGSA